MSLREILDYEVRASWWSGLISNRWLQDLSARYFARKVQRKFARWQRSRAMAETLREEAAR